MKHLAIITTGQANQDLTVVALVRLSKGELDDLKKIRSKFDAIYELVNDCGHVLHTVTCWTAQVEWLVMDHDVDDAGDDKLFQQVTDSADGFIEIPEDVYCSRKQAHADRYTRDGADHGLLRTSNDYLVVRKDGIYYTCEEHHTDGAWETNMIPWWALFGEPKPQPKTV